MKSSGFDVLVIQLFHSLEILDIRVCWRLLYLRCNAMISEDRYQRSKGTCIHYLHGRKAIQPSADGYTDTERGEIGRSLEQTNGNKEKSGVMTQRSRLVAGFQPRQSGFDPSQATWDWWWTKLHWGRFLLCTSGFPPNFNSTKFSMLVFITAILLRGWYKGHNSDRRTRWAQPHPAPRIKEIKENSVKNVCPLKTQFPRGRVTAKNNGP
jgi:hypothetical protein